MSARVESGSQFEPSAVPANGPAGDSGFDPPAWQRAGCLRNPCSADPDPALFFASPEVRQIRDTLLANLRSEPGSLSTLTGPAGIGKTALLRELELALTQARRRVAFLSCAHAEVPWRDVIESAPAPLALLLDDAENCSEPWFGELERWLAAGGRPGSHLVISGRPEVAERLQQLVDAASGGGLAATGVALEPLDAVMVGEFLAHRLWRSGFTGAWPLDEPTVHRIADRSGGVPASILRLAALEFEVAWTEEAVFAPRRAEAVVPVPAPAAPVPAGAAPAPPRRLLGDPGFRTAMAATALLAVAGTAGWLAWRTVETARVGLVEVAPPAAPPSSAVAIAPPARGAVPVSAPPGAPVAAEQRMPDVEGDTGAVLPLATVERIAEPLTAPETAPVGTVMLSARSAAAVAAPLIEPQPGPAEPPAAVPAPPLAEDLFQPDPPTSMAIAAAEPAMAAAEEEPASEPPVEQAASGSPAEPAPVADDPAIASSSVAETAAEPTAEPVSSAPPAQSLPQLAQAAPAPADATAAAPPAGAQPKAEDPPSVAPSPPPASSPLPTVAPSAGLPPAAAPAPHPQLTPAQIATYVRRGDEYVQTGDIAAARLWYERAALAGDAGAMRALGRTYDVRMLRQWGVVGMPADQARAEEWYRKAAEAQRATPPRRQQ